MNTFYIGMIMVICFIMVINLFAVTICVYSSQISREEEEQLVNIKRYSV